MPNDSCGPEIVDYISLDSLLAGYGIEPLISMHYDVSSCEAESAATTQIMTQLSSELGLVEDAYCSLEIVVAECVQNIMQHCCDGGDIRIYASQDKKKALGAFELNTEAQFGTPRHEEYKKLLNSACQDAYSPNYGLDISKLMEDDSGDDAGDPCKPEDFHLGTKLIMRTKGLSRAGIADIGGKAFFFFEYSLPDK